jgi:hypothetical protein
VLDVISNTKQLAGALSEWNAKYDQTKAGYMKQEALFHGAQLDHLAPTCIARSDFSP